MIILISPEKDLDNELEVLPKLFDAGLTHFHLRKPNKTKEELITYLDQIDPRYYRYIILHHFHDLVLTRRLKGVHFQEQHRRDLESSQQLQEQVSGWKTGGYTVSSSFHDPETIKACQVSFDYHLLSPIFDSISKAGYEGKGFEVHDIPKTIIGMGGVRADNLTQILKMGYQGAGVLGGVWNVADPLSSFESLIKNIHKENA